MLASESLVNACQCVLGCVLCVKSKTFPQLHAIHKQYYDSVFMSQALTLIAREFVGVLSDKLFTMFMIVFLCRHRGVVGLPLQGVCRPSTNYLIKCSKCRQYALRPL